MGVKVNLKVLQCRCLVAVLNSSMSANIRDLSFSQLCEQKLKSANMVGITENELMLFFNMNAATSRLLSTSSSHHEPIPAPRLSMCSANYLDSTQLYPEATGFLRCYSGMETNRTENKMENNYKNKI